MTAEAIHTGRSFYAPRFVLQVDGQDVPPHTIRDVIEVTFEDSLSALEFFEFTLHDRDPVRNAPKYSSPYDASGAPQTDAQGQPVPAFEPGMTASLSMGYYGPEDPVQKLTGMIVSIAPSFPDSGIPQMKVRVLSGLFQLQNAQATREFTDQTDTAIAQALAEDLGIAVATTPGQAAGETVHEFLMLNNEYPVNFLMRRARRLGYDLALLPNVDPASGLVSTGGADEPALFFGPSDQPPATYALAWGSTLSKFDISVRIKDQVGEVTIRSQNPAASGSEAEVEAVATLDDLDLDFPDPNLLATVTDALSDTQEVVVDEPVQNAAEAQVKALGILRERVKDMVTAEGATIGFPHLRAGSAVEITGIGPRYSGLWVLTKTTHKIDAAGYSTAFSARLEGSLP
ncbi:Phage protein D [Rhodovulum sp. P5]|uniref:phage late control D family protein n=1 Tax=Rhodovulum sp. P5 TaxID=1564506 RepID=UPI0009C26201|nr:phage late control D family protein [Rhodovulum sp. P5]ARE41826.1 Phage protein D [Rhodovulum sp. P5]